MTCESSSDWARLSKEFGKGDPDPTFPLLFHLNPASLLLSSLSRISFSFPICIDLCSNFGKCCFPGNSQILHPINIFPNTSLFVGQIPDPINTHSHPVSNLSCTLNLKPPLLLWEIILKWGNFREQNNPHPSASHPFKVGVFAVFCRWLEQRHNMVWGERGKGKLYSPLFMLAKRQRSPLGQSVFLSPIVGLTAIWLIKDIRWSSRLKLTFSEEKHVVLHPYEELGGFVFKCSNSHSWVTNQKLLGLWICRAKNPICERGEITWRCRCWIELNGGQW